MHSAAHFLIEKRVFRGAYDTRVIAKGELAEVTRTVIHLKHLLQIWLTLTSAGLDHLALVEDQAHALNRAAKVRRWHVKLNHALGTVLNRAGEKFAAGKVVLAVAIDKNAIRDRELQIGVGTQDMHLFA